MAANTGAIRAGRAFVELYADDSRLIRNLRGASDKLKAFGAVIGKLGIGAAASMFGAAVAFGKAGDALNDMSARTGMSVEGLSALKYAAEQSGASLETVETAAKAMARNLGEAATGSKAASEKFDQLGLSAAELIRLSPEEQFKAIAKRLAEIQDPTQRAAAAMKVFGKSGTDLLPMVGDLDALTRRAKELGLVMSTEDAAAAAAFDDAMTEVWATLKAGTNQLGAVLAPALTEVARSLSEIMGSLANAIGGLRNATAASVTSTMRLVDAGDKRRAMDVAQMQRLEVLAAKENLTNQETAEAKKIIDSLTTAYGPLGAALDATTGKLTGVADAWTAMTRAMAAAKVTEVRAQVAALQAQLSEKQAVAGGEGFWGKYIPSVQRAQKEVPKLRRELYILKKSLAELEGDGVSLETLTGGQKVTAAAELGGKPEFDKMGPLLHRIMQLRLGMIEDETARERALIQDKYAFEIAQAKAAGDELIALRQAEALELEGVERERVKRVAEAEQRAAEDRASKQADLADQIAKLEIEATRTGLEKTLGVLGVEHRREWAEAAAAGLDLGMVSKKQQLEIDLARAAEKPEAMKGFGVSTFSGFGLSQLGMGGGPLGQLVELDREGNRKLDRIEKAIIRQPQLAKFGK